MSSTTVAELNADVMDAFAERLLDVVNAGGMGLMLSIGHRTGLFDAMHESPPATSAQIAEQAGLHERYVREWLGAMVAGRIVDHDPDAMTYALPAEHAALLTRAASPNNMAVMMQFFSVLGGVEDRIVDCFHNGGGVNYSEYNRFHEVMAEESAQTVVAGLTEHIVPLVPGLTERLQAGIDVLDVGCGSGRAMCHLAESFPDSRFAGYDLCEEAVEAGRAETGRRGLTNVRFEMKDVTTLGESESFDLITAFDSIHDQANPAEVLSGIGAALKPRGMFLMQDIHSSTHVHKNVEHPIGAFLYTISCMHCMTVSLAQGGVGLGACWGVELAEQMLREAGFSDVVVKRLEHDFLNSYFIATK